MGRGKCDNGGILFQNSLEPGNPDEEPLKWQRHQGGRTPAAKAAGTTKKAARCQTHRGRLIEQKYSS